MCVCWSRSWSNVVAWAWTCSRGETSATLCARVREQHAKMDRCLPACLPASQPFKLTILQRNTTHLDYSTQNAPFWMKCCTNRFIISQFVNAALYNGLFHLYISRTAHFCSTRLPDAARNFYVRSDGRAAKLWLVRYTCSLFMLRNLLTIPSRIQNKKAYEIVLVSIFYQQRSVQKKWGFWLRLWGFQIVSSRRAQQIQDKWDWNWFFSVMTCLSFHCLANKSRHHRIAYKCTTYDKGYNFNFAWKDKSCREEM